MISKINELFESDKSVYFFDVDGVLAIMEFGEYNHFGLDDLEWFKQIKERDLYKDMKPNKIIQKFLSSKDKSKVYVISKAANLEEFNQKKSFAFNNYDIKPENIFMVNKDEEKLNAMNKIKELYPYLEDKYFIMIDDSVGVLNNIKENSKYSTVHISSFFDLY